MLTWILSHGNLFMLAIGVCGLINAYFSYKHQKSGRCRPGDTAYFWRLMKQGERDGKIVMSLSFLAMFLGAMLIFSLILNRAIS